MLFGMFSLRCLCPKVPMNLISSQLYIFMTPSLHGPALSIFVIARNDDFKL